MTYITANTSKTSSAPKAPRTKRPLKVSVANLFSEAANLPYLSPQREAELGARIDASGGEDYDAIDELVLAHVRTIPMLRQGIYVQGRSHEEDALNAAGLVGLWKAAKSFKAGQGGFNAYARHQIRGAMLDYVRSQSTLVNIAGGRLAHKRLFLKLPQLLKPSGTSFRPAEIEKIAQEFDVLPSDVTEMEIRLTGGQIDLDGEVEGKRDLYETLPNEECTKYEPCAMLQGRQREALLTGGIASALKCLDERERAIVTARFMTDGKPVRYSELGEQFSVSAERIRQIEHRALAKLKDALPSNAVSMLN